MTAAAEQIEAAQRKVDAIDKRIDAVRAELIRIRPGFDQMSAAGWQGAWDSVPGLQGIERSLFVRRGDAADIRDDLAFKAARAAERREAREFRKQSAAKYAANRHACPTCGFMHAA